jgi:ribulose-bisphosphate carboxylase small chain
MYLRHGAFSYLPDLSDDEIAAQVSYALLHGWPISIEHTTDPHPRNIYWEMWGLPLFDYAEADGVLAEINACRATFPRHYVRVLAYDASLGRQTTSMQFLVQRPEVEPDVVLTRTEGADRRQGYGIAVRRPAALGAPGGG